MYKKSAIWTQNVHTMYVFHIIFNANSVYFPKQHYLTARCNSGTNYRVWSGNYFFTMAQQPLGGKGLLIIEASRSHSIGLLWTSDQPNAETSVWQHTALTRERHPFHGGIRTRKTGNRAAADPQLRPRDNWDRLKWKLDSFCMTYTNKAYFIWLRKHTSSFPFSHYARLCSQQNLHFARTVSPSDMVNNPSHTHDLRNRKLK
jgi:hypothetical protein